ncbi:MAG: hypothetical protein KA205_08085 [Acidobacteria bacterium]|nr:hypothetical protein [Acidobacteriota bacterium]
MRVIHKCAVLVGALIVTLWPTLVAAAPQTTSARHTPAPQTTKDATHATNGIVKSMDATTLVIAKSTTSTKTQTFVLTPSTSKKGDLTVGVRVEVRYRAEGPKNIAIAVTASPLK